MIAVVIIGIHRIVVDVAVVVVHSCLLGDIILC